MARYGFNKSPYRPRDVNEWKAVTAATMDWKFDTGIEWLERAMQHHLEIDRSLKAGVPVAQLAGFFTDVQSALGQASGSSGLSPVLSRPSMWAATPSLSANGDWPERGRLKKAGPARARVGKWRLLPLPGTKRVDDDPVSLATEPGVPLSEPGVPGAFRRPADWAVRGVRFDCLMEHEEAEVDKPVQELELSEVNETIGSFIEGIDDFAAM
ncbi:hypothetical protein F5Y10DRAFT_231763 [Nemania abortiva]|nr:hypothetical protein F5Y10DRAFT_231763 [Nemania abortiva]